MKILFLAASAAFSAIPGISVIASGLGTPPDYKILFGGVIEAFGVIALLILWVNQEKIRRVSTKKITNFAVGLAIGSILILSLYIFLYATCVVTVEGRGTAYYPLILTGEIAKTVAHNSGSRKTAIENEGLAEIVEEIDKMPAIYIIATTILLLLTYQSIFTALTGTFGLLAFHRGQGLVLDVKNQEHQSPAKTGTPADDGNAQKQEVNSSDS